MLLSILLCSCLLSGGLQDDRAPVRERSADAPQTAAVQRYASLQEVLGEPVQLASQDGGGQAMAAGGSIRDLVLERGGRIRWAVVSLSAAPGAAAEVLLVPGASLRHARTDAGPVCRPVLSEAERRALRPFDLAATREPARLRALLRALERADAGEAGGESRDEESDEDDEQEHDRRPELLLASQLRSVEVRGSDAPFGRVADAVVDLETHNVAALIVARGDARYLLPLRATEPAGPEGAGAEGGLHVARPVAVLEAGVRYEKPEQGFVRPEALERSDAAFSAPLRAGRARAGAASGGDERPRGEPKKPKKPKKKTRPKGRKGGRGGGRGGG